MAATSSIGLKDRHGDPVARARSTRRSSFTIGELSDGDRASLASSGLRAAEQSPPFGDACRSRSMSATTSAVDGALFRHPAGRSRGPLPASSVAQRFALRSGGRGHHVTGSGARCQRCPGARGRGRGNRTRSCWRRIPDRSRAAPSVSTAKASSARSTPEPFPPSPWTLDSPLVSVQANCGCFTRRCGRTALLNPRTVVLRQGAAKTHWTSRVGHPGAQRYVKDGRALRSIHAMTTRWGSASSLAGSNTVERRSQCGVAGVQSREPYSRHSIRLRKPGMRVDVSMAH